MSKLISIVLNQIFTWFRCTIHDKNCLLLMKLLLQIILSVFNYLWVWSMWLKWSPAFGPNYLQRLRFWFRLNIWQDQVPWIKCYIFIITTCLIYCQDSNHRSLNVTLCVAGRNLTTAPACLQQLVSPVFKREWQLSTIDFTRVYT